MMCPNMGSNNKRRHTKTMPLDSIHSGLLGKSPGVTHREGIIRYPLSYQVLFDWLPGQYLTVGTYPVPQECLPHPAAFLSITRQSGGRVQWLGKKWISGAGRSGRPAWHLRACLTKLSLLLISSQEGDRSRSAQLVWKDNKTDIDHDPNLVCMRL